MMDVDPLLRSLSDADRSETASKVDVRGRVLKTLASRPQRVPLDLLPLAFTGVAVAVAVTTAIAWSYAWETLSEPWVAYFP